MLRIYRRLIRTRTGQQPPIDSKPMLSDSEKMAHLGGRVNRTEFHGQFGIVFSGDQLTFAAAFLIRQLWGSFFRAAVRSGGQPNDNPPFRDFGIPIPHSAAQKR